MPRILNYQHYSRRVRRTANQLFDAVAIVASLALALLLRMSGAVPATMWEGLAWSAPVFIAVGFLVFNATGIYRRVWRLASLPDALLLVGAAALAVTLSVGLLSVTGHALWLPLSVPVIHWFVLSAIMAGARLWRRVASELPRRARAASAAPRGAATIVSQQRALLVGRPEDVEVLLRQIEQEESPAYLPVGILDLDSHDATLRLRGVPILGMVDAIDHAVDTLTARNERPSVVIIAEGRNGSGGLPGARRVQLVNAAQALHLSVRSATPDASVRQSLDAESIDLADLLERPATDLDAAVAARAIEGKRVLVTGAGGTIGRELTRQIAAMRPSDIVLVDCGEYNLYLVEMELRENYPQVPCTAVLCSIRQRQHVMAVFEQYMPDYVFHAAALKHVPLVELNVCAGIMTNVIGTRNVADAALRFGARAFVQVSTDKAVNPVSVMGATKRLGELYVQAMDLQGAGRPDSTRFMTVRFGNVLGSSGSLIPLFQRQLARRAPLTVTHPEITRFFMTVHEAVQLVLHSTARTMERNVQRGRIVVLDMGEPIRILDIARRMIKLAGLVPDRDVPIHIVGLRPGEKLYEELFDAREQRLPSAIEGVFEAEPIPVPLPALQAQFTLLAEAVGEHDQDLARALLFELLDPDRIIAAKAADEHAGTVVRSLHGNREGAAA
ncbi:polysaccharide biosynthesis protein [Sphingomonas sp. DT-51]|uniref:polysaccharide biosynthesis protein n=1 Tax=Sphingomonas sp. DT-51 TaxID=3396165 RepID=UPI003F1A4803